ncbi:MAG: hypothetical protein ACM3U1_08060 [Chloroflexota bacterium]
MSCARSTETKDNRKPCPSQTSTYLESRLKSQAYKILPTYHDDKSACDAIDKRLTNYKGVPPTKEIAELRQLEKDETYWTASTFISLFESDHCVDILKKLLIKNFGELPPFKSDTTWDELLGKREDLQLILEAVVPAPKQYRDFLITASRNRILIPYMMQQLKPGCLHTRTSAFEGSTQVDALIINTKLDKPFCIFIEAKVLSDISPSITYDVMRNQIARNLDVMLTDSPGSEDHTVKKSTKPEERKSLSKKIDKDNSLFLLLTPRVFKENPGSRLYGYKMREYKYNPLNINADLIHRKDITDWNAVADRIGWTTWEDIWEIGDRYNAMGKDKIFMRNFPDIIETCHECVRESVKEASSLLKESLNPGSA